jgi:virulence-associated protein VagC
MMGDVLDAVLEIFASDRACILYPCDPNAPSWRAVMERIRPEFPGTRGRDLPLTVDSAEIARAALDSEGALLAGPGHGRQVEPELAEHFGVRIEDADGASSERRSALPVRPAPMLAPAHVDKG